MKTKMFGQLLESVREGGAILRGEKKPSRRFEDESSRLRCDSSLAELLNSREAKVLTHRRPNRQPR
jgi:DNA-directed RNA polymerase sigma subunit (sigma70/sigma32)